MAKIVWAYCPDDRDKQGTTEEVPGDMARAYVHEGLARYAREAPAPESATGEPEATVAPAESEPAPKKRVPAQGTASDRS